MTDGESHDGEELPLALAECEKRDITRYAIAVSDYITKLPAILSWLTTQQYAICHNFIASFILMPDVPLVYRFQKCVIEQTIIVTVFFLLHRNKS